MQFNKSYFLILLFIHTKMVILFLQQDVEKDPDQNETEITISGLASDEQPEIELRQVVSEEKSLPTISIELSEAQQSSDEQPQIEFKQVISGEQTLITISMDQSDAQLSEIHPEDATAEIQSDQAISEVELVQAPTEEHSEQAVPEVKLLKSPETQTEITVENEDKDEKVCILNHIMFLVYTNAFVTTHILHAFELFQLIQIKMLLTFLLSNLFFKVELCSIGRLTIVFDNHIIILYVDILTL